jgi:RNA polymerase sigma factor (sigma-70 family)
LSDFLRPGYLMGEMQPKSDAQLLREYAESGSESAFTELVTRHTDLVYSAALRQVSSSDLACDVAQNVFTSLARGARPLAGKLNPDVSLAGWLCRCTRNLALNLRRDDFRRHSRERQAMENLHPSPETAPDWDRLCPMLDEAICGLNEADHDALVLRFFKKQDLRSVGLALGVSDDTAQKRVSRALEKLREYLAHHGIATTGTALAMAISANAVQAAPVGLVVMISTAAVLAGTAVSTSTVIAATKTIAMTTLQKTLITATMAVLAGAGIYEAREVGQLRKENQALQQRLTPPAEQIRQLQRELNDATNQLASLRDDQKQRRLQMEHLELLGLRGRVQQLTDELRREKAGPSTAASTNVEPAAADSIFFSASLTNRVANGQTLVLGGWSKAGMRGYLLISPTIQNSGPTAEAPPLTIQSQAIGAPENFWNQIGWQDAKSDTRRSSLSAVLTSDQAEALRQALKTTPDAFISNTAVSKSRDGEYLGLGFNNRSDSGESGTLMSIDVIPRIAPDGQSVNLEICPSPVSPNTPVHPMLK